MIFRNQVEGLFWLSISIFVCVEAIGSKIGTFQSPGPGFLPFLGGVILGSLSIILIVTNFLKKKGDEMVTYLWKGRGWGKICLILLALFIYAILLPKLGYLITTFGLMIILFGVKERPKFWIQVLSALITALATYVIFYVLLQVQLPKGILGP